VSFGDHRSMIAPCGKPTKANLTGVLPAGVWAHAVAAGFIASRSGKATVAPRPFRTARRETCFLNIYISSLPTAGAVYDRALYLNYEIVGGPPAPTTSLLTRQNGLRRPPHPELFAPDHRLDQSREFVIAGR